MVNSSYIHYIYIYIYIYITSLVSISYSFYCIPFYKIPEYKPRHELFMFKSMKECKFGILCFYLSNEESVYPNVTNFKYFSKFFLKIYLLLFFQRIIHVGSQVLNI